MKASILLLLLAFWIPAISQIGTKTRTMNEGIQGKWVNNSFGYAMTLILSDGGQGALDGENMTYQVSGNELQTFWTGGESVKYLFSLSGDQLVLSGGDLDGPIMFSRQGLNNQVSSEISSHTATPVSDSNGLTGTWVSQGEEMSFMPNGTMKYNGVDMNFSTSGNTLTMQSINGSVSFQYTVNGNSLTLSNNGQSFIYSRKGSASAGSSTNQQGTVAMEMVGKWCYVNVTSGNSGGWSSDECFTLYENGTYEYYSENSGSATGYNSYGNQTYSGGTYGSNSDRGTWTVNGNSLVVNSQTQGQLVYPFQKQNHPKTNDPMIVINGRSYVTQYQKSPWR